MHREPAVAQSVINILAALSRSQSQSAGQWSMDKAGQRDKGRGESESAH